MTLRVGLAALGALTLVAAGIALASAPVAPLPPPPATGRFALGVNEAVGVPRRLLDGLAADALAAHLAQDARLTVALGARVVRGHTGAFPPVAFSEVDRPRAVDAADAWVRALQDAGLDGVGMVSPWPANRTAQATDHYLPDDLAAYTRYVGRLVERYDGDGLDDMPGLTRPIRWWEVDNEPDLKWVGAGDRTGICPPAEYARVLVASATAIRAASPEARVLNGGIFRPHADNGEAYLRDVLAVDGARDAFDILSLHTYAEDDGDRLAAGIRRARALVPDKPVWVTETSVSSDPDPDHQARVLVALVARAAAEGAERLFWHTLSDPPAGVEARGGLARNSLLRATAAGTWEEKPAAATFRRLAQRLAEDDLVGATPDGPGAVRLKSGAVLLWDGARVAPAGGWDLASDATLVAGITARAPAWLK